MRICVDFDGTIMSLTDIPKGKKMGAPIPGAKEALTKLHDQGNYIIVFSVRGDRPDHVAAWMLFFQIPFDEVTRTKPDDVAFFIDDHGLRFEGDWEETLDEVQAFDYIYQQSKKK